MARKSVILKELPKLVGEGIIKQDAADAIRAYYEKKDVPQSSMLLIAFGVMGAVLVGGGIILLLAHNWDDLSRVLRTVLSLTPLAVAQSLCGYALVKRNESIAWREATAAFIVLSIGTAIALISQTYNIYGNLGRFLLTWSLLALPVFYIMNASFSAVLYLIGIASWTGYQAFDMDYPYLFWPLCAAAAPYFFYMYKNFNQTIRFQLLTWATLIFFYISIEFLLMPWRTYLHGSWFSLPGYSLLAYGAYYSLIFLIGRGRHYDDKSLFSNPFLVIGSLAIPVMVLIYTFESSWKHIEEFSHTSIAQFSVPIWMSTVMVAMLLAAALALLIIRIRQKQYTVIPMGIGFLVASAGYALLNAGISVDLNLVLFNLYLLFIGVFTVVQGVRESRLVVINFGMLILASQIISRFFDSNLSFVLRGIIFIIFGIGFLLVNILIVKKRKSI
ncbi:MAG: hypothetical protein A2176_12580 [Spirochaetes bacterium RBG_13_51_14]|nr:MAG: hypothetical protein A2176_12580 [Spirochaetes bacterium RBG_13_51_14]